MQGVSCATLVNSCSRSLSLFLGSENPKRQPFSSISNISGYGFPTSGFHYSHPFTSGVEKNSFISWFGHYVVWTEVQDCQEKQRNTRNCMASQVAELFPTTSPEVVVREARIDDCWEVAETHCSSFFPAYTFPLDLALRVNRLIGMLFGFSSPNGCKRTFLVAVIGSSVEDLFFLGSKDFKIGVFEGKFSLNKGNVAGILTVDTVADFLPRKGPLRQRRTGIAYISNVAVRDEYRRKGIAKRLIAKAETEAKSWGCRSIALHCDLNNCAATVLYASQGYKTIKVPEGANWPYPKASQEVRYSFMMKLL